MLVPSGSYKYCSWESKWLLTWLTRAFPSSSFLDGIDSNKSEIFFTSPNSHNNRVSIKIGSENKQTETEREEKRCLTRPHARRTRLRRSLRALPTRACPTRFSPAQARVRGAGSGASRAAWVGPAGSARLTRARCRVRTRLTSR